jgi:RNA polymerase sigma factor (sigma-70 family)
VEYIRRKTRAKKYFTPAADNFSAFPDCNSPDAIAQISDQELRNDIQLALKALPLDQKTAFSLYYFGNYSGKEVAEALNISEANFFMKLKAARDTMKKKLMQRGWHL